MEADDLEVSRSISPERSAGNSNLDVTVPDDSRLAMLEKARVLGDDRFRLLRHHLQELRMTRTLKRVIVTSAIPKDGKSTISINTAAALAHEGRNKVLLIEADLHCPSIARTLGLDKLPGTAECLEGGDEPWPYVRKINPLGFSLLQAGHGARHPTDLIQSDAFPKLLSDLAAQFEWVIIDTPPVCPVPDTVSMWKHVDGVLMVVRSGVTPQDRVAEVLQLLGPTRLAAVVFNGSVEATESYYKYSSYYGTKYGESKSKR